MRHFYLFTASVVWLLLTVPCMLAGQQGEYNQLAARVDRLYRQGNYAEGITVAQQAVTAAENTFGAKHENVALMVFYLGVFERETQQFADAESHFKRSLGLYEEIKGPDDISVASVLSHLGRLYKAEGNPAAAEPLYRRSLAIAEKKWGPNSPEIIEELRNLAFLCLETGKYDEAEALYKKSVSIKEAEMGPNDPALAELLWRVAEVYRSERKYAEAESTYNRILSIEESKVGKNSLRLVDWLDLAGEVFREDNKYSDAETLFARAVSIADASPTSDPQRLAHSLTELAGAYTAEKKFAVAEPLYARALNIREKSTDTDPRTLATTLCNLATMYASEGENSKGSPLFHRAIELWKTYLTPRYPEFAESLNTLEPLFDDVGRYREVAGELSETIADVEKLVHTTSFVEQAMAHARFARFLENESKYSEAERLYRRDLAIRKGALAANDVNVATASLNLAQLLRKEGKYSEAEALDRQALDVFEQHSDLNAGYVGAVLSNLGVVVQHQGRYSEAERLFRRSIEILDKIPHDPDLPIVLFNLGKLYFEESRNEEAEQQYKRSLELFQSQGLGNSSGYGKLQVELAALYADEGKYAESEQQALTALHALEKTVGPDHPSVAYPCLVLAEVYTSLSRPSEADQFERRALEIAQSTLGTHDPELPIALDRVATFYDLQGNFIAAEPLAEEALRIGENVFGPNSPSVTNALSELAILYREHGRFQEAETLCKQALKNAESASPSEPLLIAASLNGLAGVYKDQARFADAEPLYQRAVSVSEGTSQDPRNLAVLVSNLATLYYDEGKFYEAEPLLKRALGTVGNGSEVDNPDVGTVTSTLASLYYLKGQPEDAQPLFARSLRNLSHQFRAHFSYMSEKQRLLFLQMVFDRFPMFFSFCTSNHEKYPGLVADMYDVLLWEKGLVARSIASQRVRLAEDTASVTLINQLTAKEEQLARLHATLPADRAQDEKTINQLENETEAIQRELARRSSRIAQENSFAAVEWRDVQKVLAKDEAAVEFVRFSFATKGQPRNPFYVALVLTPEMTVAPALVPLGPAAELEGPAIAQYRRTARLDTSGVPINGPTFYDYVWKPLEPLLAGKKRVFLSTDGILNQVSFAVVSDNQQLLIEKYEAISMVSSTSDLTRERTPSSKRSAVLMGDPKFDLGEAEYNAALAAIQPGAAPHSLLDNRATPSVSIQSGSVHFREQGQGTAALKPLSGTKDELKAVRELLEANGWKVDVYLEEKARKETLIAVTGPRILHVATHGFFLGDQERRRTDSVGDSSGLEDAMLRSGLYLAGANRYLGGKVPASHLGDGVLTAYEATGLNLQGTELVILSACDTGLGEVRNGEGVFGLRRALQEAGAEAVLMSMWPVPDIETKELITSFYEKWVAGSDKQHALKDAELDEKKRTKERWGKDRPDLWGAFVLVGR